MVTRHFDVRWGLWTLVTKHLDVCFHGANISIDYDLLIFHR